MYKKWMNILILGFLVVICISNVAAQDEGYIYGKIILRNGNTYEGPIRWGKEETFWTDIFNSDKAEDVFETYLEDADGYRDLRRSLRDQGRRRRSSFWGGRIVINNQSTSHSFKCRFGDIARLDFRGRESVRLEMKNGEVIRLDGGSNDVGATLILLDPELEEVELKWRHIDAVEFSKTPSKLDNVFGEPLFGTVKTDIGTFKGFIQWDHQESVGTDILDGDSEDGSMKIRFKTIKSIERYRRGSKVVLNSGREYYLTGSNDVNSENRGVIVKDPVMGKVKIGWKDFDRVDFEKSTNSGMAFTDFKVSKELKGVVTTKDGEKFNGRIYYDLDEAWDIELLDGNDGDVEYLIPFRSVKQIIPDGRWGSEVVLVDGRKIMLEESRDIDDDNAGLIVQSGKKLKYIEWRDIRHIEFDN
ncbi:hypothetical protein KAR48_09405 [bacterium]|nr:hypothetical protein [bacterium]